MPHNRVFGACICHFGAENAVFRSVLGDFETEARRRPLARVGGLRGEWGAPRDHANAKTRCHVPCGAAGAPWYPLPLRGAGFSFSAAGRREAAVSPALVFSPVPPPFGGAPFSVRIIGRGGKPIPVRSLALPHWGQPHGGQINAILAAAAYNRRKLLKGLALLLRLWINAFRFVLVPMPRAA